MVQLVPQLLVVAVAVVLVAETHQLIQLLMHKLVQHLQPVVELAQVETLQMPHLLLRVLLVVVEQVVIQQVHLVHLVVMED